MLSGFLGVGIPHAELWVTAELQMPQPFELSSSVVSERHKLPNAESVLCKGPLKDLIARSGAAEVVYK